MPGRRPSPEAATLAETVRRLPTASTAEAFHAGRSAIREDARLAQTLLGVRLEEQKLNLARINRSIKLLFDQIESVRGPSGPTQGPAVSATNRAAFGTTLLGR